MNLKLALDAYIFLDVGFYNTPSGADRFIEYRALKISIQCLKNNVYDLFMYL